MHRRSKSLNSPESENILSKKTVSQSKPGKKKSSVLKSPSFSNPESFLSSPIALSPEAISLIRLRDGLYIDVNEAFIRLTGYDRSEILGKTTRECPFWSDRFMRLKFLKEVSTNRSLDNLRAGFVMKSGSERIGLISARIISYEDEEHILCFIRDITEYEATLNQLKAAEQHQKKIAGELERTSKLLEAIFNSIPDIIGIQDPEHRIIRYNRAGYASLGITAEEAGGKRCFELIGQNTPCQQCATTETYITRKPARIEKYVPQTNVWFDVRSYPILNEQGDIEFVIEHLRDITREKNINEALKKSAERLELALKGADLGMWDWNIETGELNHSARWSSMLGYNPEEINSDFEAWKDLVHPDDRQMVLDTLQAHLDRKTDAYESEHRLRSKSGEWLWILDRGRIVEHSEDGKVKRLAGTHLDITNRKHAEEENERLQAQLNQARKMEAVGTLAGGIAHDFNNLLTVINGYSEITLMKLDTEHAAYNDVVAIQKAGARAENLTRQLLAFSRKQVFEPRSIDLNTVIQGLDSMMRRLIGEDIDIEAVLDPDLPAIKADPGQLEQILVNLLINARDAINQRTDSASEKKITVETGRTFLDDDYVSEHVYSRKGAHVMISISDTGIGMEKDIIAKIFEPFFTTKERGKGTGLGLATVYGIVKQNEGHITVYSEPGEGSTFRIYWPLSEESGTINMGEIKETESIRGSERILLVEDDQGVRNFAYHALSNYGYKVTAATNGLEALDILVETESDSFDMLVTDLIMPQMNGHELASKLQELNSDALVLFTSGYPENHIVHNGHLQEGLHFLHKPYSVQALARKVREVLDDHKER